MVDHLDVAGYVLGTLTAQETSDFEAHLAGCVSCRAEVAELGPLPSLLASAELAPPGELGRRTFDAIAAAVAQPPPRAGGPPRAAWPPGRVPPWDAPPVVAQRPSPASAGGPASAEGGATVIPLRRRAARWLGAAAAALLVAAAVGVGIVLFNRGGGTETTVALVAAEAGSAGGQATIRTGPTGQEVQLAVHGLPASAPGWYYECWFVGPGDSEQRPNRVSAGTFTVGANGQANVRLVSAADPAKFPKLGVTLEPDDGNPGRTGPKYLVSSP